MQKHIEKRAAQTKTINRSKCFLLIEDFFANLASFAVIAFFCHQEFPIWKRRTIFTMQRSYTCLEFCYAP